MGVLAWIANEEAQTNSLDKVKQTMGEGEVCTKESVQQDQTYFNLPY